MVKTKSKQKVKDKNKNIDFQEAKNFLINREKESLDYLRSLEDFFKDRYQNNLYDEEKELENIFYLILTKLRMYYQETPEIKKYFFEFTSIIRNLVYKKLGNPKTRFSKHSELEVNFNLKIWNNKIHANQIKFFLQICEYYLIELERNYKDIGMSERVSDLYKLKMDVKKYTYFIEKKFLAFFGLVLFKFISGYGTSLIRLAITCTLSVTIFAFAYWLADYFSPENLRMINSLCDYSSYFFNSLVTITGLGIDAKPVTGLQRLAMGINTIYGMVVFGLLFNVISTKLSINE